MPFSPVEQFLQLCEKIPGLSYKKISLSRSDMFLYKKKRMTNKSYGLGGHPLIIYY